MNFTKQTKMPTDNSEILKRINTAIDEIRPYLQADGGDIRFVELDENMVVKVELLGACGNCPMSLQTLKAGVEISVKRYVPEIHEVIAIDSNVY